MTDERRKPHLAGMPKRREPRSLALSIAIHVLVIVGLATITFHYPIGQLLGIPKPRQDETRERLRYIALPRPEPIGNGANPTAPPPKGTARGPAPLKAPTTVPTGLPPVSNEPQPSQGAVSGKAGGTGGAPSGVATGIEPAQPDPRVGLQPYPYVPMPRTTAEAVDSSMKAAWGIYVDSERIAAMREGNIPRAAKGDWTVTDKNGNKWGWDQGAIRLGKVSIPNAVLAALPLKGIQGNPTQMADMRSRAFIRQDIQWHAQQAITEDEFRNAVRRIRERKERERKELEKERDRSRTPIADGKDPGR